MDENLQEDWLDARLRDEAIYIDDAGFTAQVMQKLPARRARRSFRGLALICITLFASFITYAVSDGGRFVVAAFEKLAAMPLLYICVIAVACCVLLSIAAAGAAISKVREEFLR
jgi:hypothetical protein